MPKQSEAGSVAACLLGRGAETCARLGSMWVHANPNSSPEDLRLGRQYVGDRLRTATLDYEETGWYDGATFHKPQEVLVRDRLLAAYEVRACAFWGI